jgi:hypothetical protein
MKIKMKTRAAGELVAEPGQVVDVDAARGKELIAGGFAEAEGAAAKETEESSDGPEADGGADKSARQPRRGKAAD